MWLFTMGTNASITRKQIVEAVTNAKHVLLIPHAYPDGDALGAVAALMQWLRSLGIAHMSFCATPISKRGIQLPHMDYIVSDPTLWTRETFDLIIVVDSGDLRYAGVAEFIDRLPHKPTIINIDHHASNEYFGALNLVSVETSSTSELLYHFFISEHIPVTAEIATCLLAGLLFDTNNFTNAATSKEALHVGSELVRRGGNISYVRNSLFKDKSVGTLRLWGLALSRLTKHEHLDLVHTYITQNDLIDCGVEDKDTEGISNFLSTLGEGQATLLLKERPGGQIKGSFRTKHDHVDVAFWASLFGGGGHKKAAGFVMDGTIESVLAACTTKLQTLSTSA